MYPDSGFAHPISSFQAPVPVPDVEPGDTPLVFPRINETWLKYLIGAAKQLLLQSTWDTDDPEVLALAQQRTFDLMSLLSGHLPNWEPNETRPGFLTFLAEQRGMGNAGPFYLTVRGMTHSTLQFRDTTTHVQVGGLVNQCVFSDPTRGMQAWTLTVTETSGVTHDYASDGDGTVGGVNVVSELGGPFQLKEIRFDTPLGFPANSIIMAINMKNDWTWSA